MYINTATLAYPYSFGQLRVDNPQVSFPKAPSDELLASFGVMPVAATEQPTYNPMAHRVVEAPPAQIDGVWTQQWALVELTPAEQFERVEALQADIVALTQKRLDNFARTRNYDSILSACTYATSTIPVFQAEGQYCVDARDNTWATLYQIMAQVQAGTRPMPTGFADVEADLPPLEWPA